jgi:HTH-type transcriptional regulator/antitoxin HigA
VTAELHNPFVPTDANAPPPKHPGKFLSELMAAKGWTQDDLAAITGLSRQGINYIIAGKRSVTPQMAIALGAAFENDPAAWLQWNAQYELAVTVTDRSTVERRARLFSLAPIRDMQRRGWISEADDTEGLEKSLGAFFGGPLDRDVAFPIAAKKTAPLDALTPAERAWCFRARQLAAALPPTAPFAPRRLASAEKQLREAAAFPKEARKVHRILSEHGIRFVVVEPLPGVKMDGAAFWLDKQNPVIALSLRFDRVDAVWFTLMHEFKHIEYSHWFSFDSNLISERDGKLTIPLSGDADEEQANRGAASALIPSDELDSFIRRLAPLYSRDRIIQFAHRMRIHPGIIVGQLQYRGELGYSAHRELLAKVRTTLAETAFTDGWGQSISPALLQETPTEWQQKRA